MSNKRQREVVKQIKKQVSTVNHSIRVPPSVRQKALFFDIKTSFYNQDLAHRQKNVPEKEPKYPYNLAKVVHHNYDMSKRWHVEFWAWNVATNQKERVRLYKPLNEKHYKNVNERMAVANSMVYTINAQLMNGKVLGKDEVENEPKSILAADPARFTILNAIDWVRVQKEANGHRNNYVRAFKTLHTQLTEWLEFQIQPDFPLRDFTKQDATDFFKYLRDEKKKSNKTINNALGYLRIAFNFIEKQSNVTRIFKKDPLQHLSKLPVIVKKHAAYSDDQVRLIKKEIERRIENSPVHRREGYRQLQLFISFIYYSLARPNELVNITVGDINMQANRILIKGEISKNRTDDYVEISPQLRTIIIESGILNYDPLYFVFGNQSEPGLRKVHSTFFWRKHNYVLTELGLLEINPHYSLYSYKHSGVISLYKQTKDIKLVQRQCRHKSIEQTNIYLRDLGVLSDYDQLKNWKGAV